MRAPLLVLLLALLFGGAGLAEERLLCAPEDETVSGIITWRRAPLVRWCWGEVETAEHYNVFMQIDHEPPAWRARIPSSAAVPGYLCDVSGACEAGPILRVELLAPWNRRVQIQVEACRAGGAECSELSEASHPVLPERPPWDVLVECWGKPAASPRFCSWTDGDGNQVIGIEDHRLWSRANP